MLLTFIGWLIASCILMSFIEHQAHARIMHRRFLPSVKLAVLDKVFKKHAGVHHGHYSAIFSDEPVAKGEDRGIRLNVVEGVIESLPFALLFALFTPIASVAFVIMVATHHLLWNAIHLEMHKPEQRPFSKTAVYKFLARHHMMHHRYPSKHMNVVFPIADYVLGTVVKPTFRDKTKFYELGLLRRQTSVPVPAKVAAASTPRTLVRS